ncbi:amidohydrolase [Filobacillus milosensis]|uniref:Amidohydrolase n=1 Tax=Filobacillus milosensis TaxID=94137 RepID=A0A4Y8IV64_9BACI|nr:amidohydrolase [Filobacillus milosensis]TFB25059.1 amidohydrolase [Filobacillus milosensis]
MIIDNVRLYQAKINQNDLNDIFHIELENEKIKSIIPGRYQGNDQDLYDAKEHVMSASFNDSHMHLLRYGLLKKELDLTQVSSWAEMKEAVEYYYKEMEEGQWVFGKGFDDSKFDDIDHLLTADDLGEINVNDYMYFMHQDGHECVISHSAMNLLKQEKDFEKEPDIFKEKNSDGQWNGRFKDTAVHYIKHHFWGRPVKDAKQALLNAFPYLLKYGITSVHTDDINFMGSYEKLWQAYTELEDESKLPIDVMLHHYIFDKEDLLRYINRSNLRTGDGTQRVKVGAIKIFLDGTQRLHTAAMRNPYPDQPDSDGTLIYSQSELDELVSIAAENDMQVAMHAIGDRAVEEAIVALEQENARTSALKHRIIHAQTLAPDLIQRLKTIKPYIETQPSFLISEWNSKEQWTPKDLLPYCDAFNSLMRDQIPITLSSDLPIGSLNPMESVYAAVTRMDLGEQPDGGWMPQERISVDDAFHGFTSAPAELEFKEKVKGKIESGYQADFILLNKHPLEAQHKDLKDITVMETWSKGKQVFKK